MSNWAVNCARLFPHAQTLDSRVNSRRDFESARRPQRLFLGRAAVYKNVSFFRTDTDLWMLPRR